jgi:hypothetical protein
MTESKELRMFANESNYMRFFDFAKLRPLRADEVLLRSE